MELEIYSSFEEICDVFGHEYSEIIKTIPAKYICKCCRKTIGYREYWDNIENSVYHGKIVAKN